MTMNPLEDPENADEATETINRYAASDWCAVSFSEHALLRMEERTFPSNLVTLVLQNGRVTDIRSEITRSGLKRWTYRVELVDEYGQSTVVTAVPGRFKLHIVTVFPD